MLSVLKLWRGLGSGDVEEDILREASSRARSASGQVMTARWLAASIAERPKERPFCGRVSFGEAVPEATEHEMEHLSC